MRGQDREQPAMFSYITLEQRIPPDHPLRAVRAMTDRALRRLEAKLDKLYSGTGRQSIPPERLLRARLRMVLYSLRSERQLIEPLNFNLLFRWFVGLPMDDPVWDVTVFTKNRERLIQGEVSQQLLRAVLAEAPAKGLLSAEHFSVDGTLIQAWAAARSFPEKSDPPAPGQGSGKRGALLRRDQVESTTDPEARRYKKSSAARSVPSDPGHVLMENRQGLAVAAPARCAGTAEERAAALVMLGEVLPPVEAQGVESAITLGADTQYQDAPFISTLRDRGIVPHISEYTQGINVCKNALREEERRDPRREISQRKRKLIERVLGGAKLDRPRRQVKRRSLKRVDWFYRLVITAYNRVRLQKLLSLQRQVA